MSNALELSEWLEEVRPGFISAMAGLTGNIGSIASLLHVKSYIFNPSQTLILAAVCTLVAAIFGTIGYSRSRKRYSPNQTAETLAITGFCLAVVSVLAASAQLFFHL
ncbi:MAG: hypothetical protein ACLPM3_07110 [Terracidiphilus sp.]